jgi:hypothetical protein
MSKYNNRSKKSEYRDEAPEQDTRKRDDDDTSDPENNNDYDEKPPREEYNDQRANSQSNGVVERGEDDKWFTFWGEATFELSWGGTLRTLLDNKPSRKFTISNEILRQALLPKGRNMEEDTELKTKVLLHDNQNCYQAIVAVVSITNDFNKSFDIVASDPDLNVITKGGSMKYMCSVPARGAQVQHNTAGGFIVNRTKNIETSKAIENLAEHSPIRTFYSSIHTYPDAFRTNDGREFFIGIVIGTPFADHILGEQIDPKDPKHEKMIFVLDRLKDLLKAANQRCKVNGSDAQILQDRLRQERPDLEPIQQELVWLAYGESISRQEKIKRGFIDLSNTKGGLDFTLLPKKRKNDEDLKESFLDITDVPEFSSNSGEPSTKNEYIDRYGSVSIELYMKCVYPHIGMDLETEKYENERQELVEKSKKFYSKVVNGTRTSKK